MHTFKIACIHIKEMCFKMNLENTHALNCGKRMRGNFTFTHMPGNLKNF